MASIRVKFEDGVFIPLDDVSDIAEGDEFVLTQPNRYTAEENAALMAWLERTRGMWADLDMDLSYYFDEDGLERLEAWRKRFDT